MVTFFYMFLNEIPHENYQAIRNKLYFNFFPKEL